MVRVAATGVPLSCARPSQVGRMRRRAAETVTRAWLGLGLGLGLGIGLGLG